MNNLELKHWPSLFGKHALARVAKGYIKTYLFLAILFVVCMGLYLVSKIYLGFAIPYTKLGARVAVIGMLIGPLLPLISYLQRNKKYPSYGLNKEGFLLNERGWDAAFFNWDEIKDLKEFDHPKFGKELHFEFVSFTKALNKKGQDKFTQALNREYVTQKHPKKISPELVKGDLTDFILKFQEYYSEFKNENPLSDFEAYELGKNYLKELHLGFRISSKKFEKIESLENAEGPLFSFPVEDQPNLQLLVSIKDQKVEGMYSNGKVAYPHKTPNNLSKDESIELVKQHLGEKQSDVKIKHAYFHFAGIYEYPHPCWIVYTKNLQATMEGTLHTDYVIDAVTKEVKTSLSS